MYFGPRVTPKRTKVSRTSKLTTTAPILAIILLLSVAFVIAALVVLSLIPLYLPTKSATLALANKNYQLSMDFDGDTGSDGDIDNNSREDLAREVERSLGLPSGSITVTSARVSTISRRKRQPESYSFVRVKRATRRRRLTFTFVMNVVICQICSKPNFFRTVQAKPVSVTIYVAGIVIVVNARVDVSTTVEVLTPAPPVRPTTSTTTTRAPSTTAAPTTTQAPATQAPVTQAPTASVTTTQDNVPFIITTATATTTVTIIISG